MKKQDKTVDKSKDKSKNATVETASNAVETISNVTEVKLAFEVTKDSDSFLQKYKKFADKKETIKIKTADFNSRKGLIANVYARIICRLLAKHESVLPSQVNAEYMKLGGKDVRIAYKNANSLNDSTQHQGMHSICMGFTNEFDVVDNAKVLSFARSVLVKGEAIFPVCSKDNSVSFKNNKGEYKRLPNVSASDYQKMHDAMMKNFTYKELIAKLEALDSKF